MFEKVFMKVAVGVAAAIAAGLGWDIHQHRKLAEKIDVATKDLKNATVADIQEGLVKKAVQDAATEKVSGYVTKVNAEVLAEARTRLGDEARKAVKESAEKIHDEVSERISTEASLLDMTALKKAVREKAEAKVLDKFDGNLEDLLSKFNNDLNHVTKIYGSIADMVSRNNTKSNDGGLKLTLG